MAHARGVTPETLGAWVIKCHPRRTPVTEMRAAGAAGPVWCVAPNYRSRLMQPGQRVLFWVSAHPQRGIWGAGRIAAYPADDGAGLRVPVQSNPSWVSTTELALIDQLLPHRRGEYE